MARNSSFDPKYFKIHTLIHFSLYICTLSKKIKFCKNYIDSPTKLKNEFYLVLYQNKNIYKQNKFN